MITTAKETVIIIPTYNERDNIATIVKKIFSTVGEVSILVVDDSSPDKTAEIVKSLQSQYPSLSLIIRDKKEGLGKAYRQAFKSALENPQWKKIIMMDADFSHDPAYLPALIGASENKDVVVASRYVAGGSVEGWEAWRKFLSSGGNWYCRFITQIPIHDCTGGFNLISANCLRSLNLDALDASGYAFQIELKYRLWKFGASFLEIPIVFKNRINGESKISNHIIKEGILLPWKLLLKK